MLGGLGNFCREGEGSGLFSRQKDPGHCGGGERMVERGREEGADWREREFLCANFVRSCSDKGTKSRAFRGLIPQAGVPLMPAIL